METWPATLPQTLLIEGYEEKLPDVNLRSAMEVGPAKVRRRVTAAVRPVTAAQNNNNGRSIKMGDINIVIPANAAPQRPEDWRAITRNYIVPELRKLNA